MTISLVSLLVYLVIIGLILYVIQILPIDVLFKRIAYVVVCVFVLLWLISLLGGGPTIRLG